MPGVAHVDLAPPRWFLTDDVAPDVTEDGWQVIDGTIGHNHRPGIGVEIDELALGGIVERSATLPVR